MGTMWRWFKSLDSPIGFVVTLIGLAAVYFSAIEWRVNLMVRDPDFMAQLARRARPSMVFDSEGSVLADTGARSLLESDPKVVPTRKVKLATM